MILKLREILKERHLTLSSFADMTGISQSNLSNYINGNISPTLDTLEKIASALQIELVELFKHKEDIELLIRYNNQTYSIEKKDLIDIIQKKIKENEIR